MTAPKKPIEQGMRNGMKMCFVAVPPNLYSRIFGLALASGREDFSKQALWMLKEWMQGRGANPPMTIPKETPRARKPYPKNRKSRAAKSAATVPEPTAAPGDMAPPTNS